MSKYTTSDLVRMGSLLGLGAQVIEPKATLLSGCIKKKLFLDASATVYQDCLIEASQK